MSLEMAKVHDAYGRLMAIAEWEEEDLFDVEEEGLEGHTWDSELPPLPSAPKCKVCKICGGQTKHYSRCSQCPHRDNIKLFKTYEASPCSDCGTREIGLKNGHGKVYVYDESVHARAYIQPEEIESDESYKVVLDVLRSFANLSPREFYAFILTRYHSFTQPEAGEAMQKEWGVKFSRQKVAELVETANEKMGEVIQAGRVLRGKITG